VEDLKQRVVRGGIARLFGQVANLALRLGFTAVMARLLHPEDFGLVAMVVAVTGIYDLFTSAGLSLATIQRASITEEQISTLFWINLIVGSVLCLLCVATAPLLVGFYHEPRLFWVTVVMGAGFLLNATGIQHSALMQRELRYVDLTMTELASLLVGYSFGIGLAAYGFGYWALVGSTVLIPAVSSALMWIFSAWVPSLPRRRSDIRSLLGYGGTITLNNLIVYVAYNFDKLLIGRVWGASALGLYGTAYQLANVPTRNLTGAVGGIAFSALSRLQGEPIRLKSYFLKGCSLLVSVTAPITIFSALFADDIVFVVLGPKWADAATIFRLLAPTILVFSVINPTGWLLQSTGLHRRSLWIALVIAPLVIGAYLIGLPYGPRGVAFGFSAAMTLWVVPHVMWCLHNTTISPSELLLATARPFLASTVAAVLAFGAADLWFNDLQFALLRLALAGVVMAGAYFAILLYVMGEKAFYLNLLSGLKSSSRDNQSPELVTR
jgi:PST family polysaccharide transporter